MFSKIIDKIKYFLTNTNGLKWVMPFLRKTGLLHLWHVLIRGNVDRVINREERKEFAKFCEDHAKDFRALNGMLEDDLSRRTMKQVIQFRKTWRIRDLKGIICKNQYFQKDIFGPVKDEVFVDGGAYCGDTINDLIRVFGKGENYCKRIFAWEPDGANIRLMKKNLAGCGNLTIIKKGMWQDKAELTFQSGGAVARGCLTEAI